MRLPWSVLLACAAVSWGSVSCSSGDDGGKAGAGPTPGAEAGAEASVDAGGSGGGGAGDASAPDVASEAACVPSTCVQLEAECGSVKDGCGGVLECGTCPTGKTCGGSAANKCGDAACTPKTCAQLGASCGQVSDGCASLLDCGWCTAPESWRRRFREPVRVHLLPPPCRRGVRPERMPGCVLRRWVGRLQCIGRRRLRNGCHERHVELRRLRHQVRAPQRRERLQDRQVRRRPMHGGLG